MDEMDTRAQRFEEHGAGLHAVACRIQATAPGTGQEPVRHRQLVDAWLTATRCGCFDALQEILDPDVVLRVNFGPVATTPSVVRGAQEVLGRARSFVELAEYAHAALIDGRLGIVTMADGELWSVSTLTVSGERITAIDIVADPAELARTVYEFLG